MEDNRYRLNTVFDTTRPMSQHLGRISSIRLDEDSNVLHLRLEDGTKLQFLDEGQSCCERRYMRTDDDLSYYVGAVVTRVEIRQASPYREDEYGDRHDIQFFVLVTDRGNITFSNHNEHNGYYAGFILTCIRDDGGDNG